MNTSTLPPTASTSSRLTQYFPHLRDLLAATDIRRAVAEQQPQSQGPYQGGHQLWSSSSLRIQIRLSSRATLLRPLDSEFILFSTRSCSSPAPVLERHLFPATSVTPSLLRQTASLPILWTYSTLLCLLSETSLDTPRPKARHHDSSPASILPVRIHLSLSRSGEICFAPTSIAIERTRLTPCLIEIAATAIAHIAETTTAAHGIGGQDGLSWA